MDLAREIGLTVLQGRDATGNPVLEEDEKVLESFENVTLILSTDSDQGLGILYFTGGRLLWLSSKDDNLNFAVPFATISMHAIAHERPNATDSTTDNDTSIYIQLDDCDNDECNNDEAVYPELSLIPSDSHLIEDIFRALCEGAERNPDPDVAEEGQGSLYYDRSEVLAGAFGHMDAIEDPERFEDADENEVEDENGHSDVA
jgi:nucleotide-sensitive chloride channel 1A